VDQAEVGEPRDGAVRYTQQRASECG
jgi:hypothetical protein